MQVLSHTESRVPRQTSATDARPQMPSHRGTNRVRTNREYQSSAPALKNSMPMSAACSCRPMANFPTTVSDADTADPEPTLVPPRSSSA